MRARRNVIRCVSVTVVPFGSRRSPVARLVTEAIHRHPTQLLPIPQRGDSDSRSLEQGSGTVRRAAIPRLRTVKRLRMSAAESAPVWRQGRSKQGATNAMPRRKLFKTDTWEFGHDSRAQEQPLAKPSKHRAATTVVYAALFFAGATFTAFAGDHFSQMTGSEDS